MFKSFFHQPVDMTVRYQDVVCAFLVENEDNQQSKEELSSTTFRVLCSQRYDDAEHFPSMYEFPGGKVDEGETHIQTMKRECLEELGITVEPIIPHRIEGDEHNVEPCYAFHHEPKQDKRLGGLVTFRLFFYWAKMIDKANPKALASQKVEWLTPEEMGKLTFCPGDEGIIQDMLSGALRPPA